MRFEVVQACSETKARRGLLSTPHGEVPTPAFMPVGTQATVKTLTPEELRVLGATIILANTYHLYLRPGAQIIQRLGGLHRFMAWDGPLLTDSGGFQVFSLGHLRQMTEEGVLFRSHLDGSEHFLTPEGAIEVQEQLGADIIMCLDECPPSLGEREAVQRATERSDRWARRCKDAHKKQEQALFAVVQGGISMELRRASVDRLLALGFSGYAIGGLSLGEPKSAMYDIAEATAALLPQDKPRYLMGVGSPEDLLEGVARGMDLFDCVLPTRIARNGAFYTRRGRVNIRNAVFKEDPNPVEAGCQCYTCRTFSAAYLHHLFKAEELLAYRLATIHNLRFVLHLMGQVREAIRQETFPAFKRAFEADYRPTNEEIRVEQKAKWVRAQRVKGQFDSA